MKYGITKPHITYKNGWWICEQKHFMKFLGECPFSTFLIFSEEKYKQVQKYKKIFSQDQT